MFSIQNTITTQNRLAIRDGFVEIPDAMRFRQKLTVEDALAVVPGATIAKLTFAHLNEDDSNVVLVSDFYPFLGGGPSITDEWWFMLPKNLDNANPTPTDWYQVLRTAAAAKLVT